MSLPVLSGAQKTKLRSLGQVMEASLLVGQAGATPGVLGELNRLLAAHELVKVRFMGADRDQREVLTAALATQAPCIHAGSVGATALFYRPHLEVEKRGITL
jgi:RNA-binding protein